MSEPFIGQITLFPYTYAPEGWADCAGQLLPIPQNSILFALLGTAYGGNGTSNFALPNLNGRVAVGQGEAPAASDYVIGSEGGVETVTLTQGSLPAHTHALNATTAQATATSPAGALFANSITPDGREANKGNIYNAANPDTALAANAIGPAGTSQPHNNIQPSLALRYCIALQGVFPMRQ
nr:tail fiber protein [uncultured Rhodopila sp.]